MKKLVAISVLFAGLAMAVSAQWSNEWKVSFLARYMTDMFYAAKATGSVKTTQETTPATSANAVLDANGTTEMGYGKYAKGVVAYFPGSNGHLLPIGGDNRLMITLQNEGENYAFKVNITQDNDWNNIGSVGRFLTTANIVDDWGLKGTAGIFSLGLGSWAVEACWVGPNAMWGSWVGWNNLNRWGVARWTDDAAGNYLHSNHFRSMSNWQHPFAVGVALGDNYKVTLGYTWPNWSPDTAVGKDDNNKSSINGKFMLSGSPADMIAFDLFYAVKGEDTDTFSRPADNFGYNFPSAYWQNIIGAYVQVKGIENLDLSVGYTVNFNAYEAGGFLYDSGKLEAVTLNTPVYSGVDLRVGYSGIDKIGLKWNNNFSFANVKGEKFDASKYQDKVVTAFDEGKALGDGYSQGWFRWESVLQANLGFLEGVGLEVSLGERLGVATDKQDTLSTGGLKTDAKTTKTNHNFFALAGAKYAVGNVSLGIALVFDWASTTVESETTTKTLAGVTKKNTGKSITDTVKFGIPVSFMVSF